MESPLQTITSHLDRPLVMIGLMGSGKTKIGSLLAQALNIPFVDADHEIEVAAGMTIADIFETHGEPAFRDLERKVIGRLISSDLKVIATGGGAVMNDQTAELIWSKGISIWIKADLDVLVERTSRNAKRPLLKNGNPRDILQNLMNIRYPVYQNADLTIETNIAEAEITTDKLIKILADYVAKEKVS